MYVSVNVELRQSSLEDILPSEKPDSVGDGANVAWDGGSRECQSLPRRCSRRRQERQRQEAALKEFLNSFDFSDVCEPRANCKCSCFRWLTGEVVYPIHEAARIGNARIVRLLLQANADPAQRTSKGRSAAEIARGADQFGSHAEVLDMLVGGLKVLQLREAVAIMMQDTSRTATWRQQHRQQAFGQVFVTACS